MSITQLHDRVSSTLLMAFLLSLVFGAIARHTRFCTMGAISDVVHLGDWTRLRQWAAAAGTATLGFALLAFTGWVDPLHTLYASTRLMWLSALAGGAAFGVGMVLASGCGNKTLVRVGGGNLKALVVLLVMAVAAFATLKGITAVVRVSTLEHVRLDLPAIASFPELLALVLPVDRQWLRLCIGLGLGAALLGWAAAKRPTRDVHSLSGGVAIGLIIVAAWALSGHWAMVDEHPVTLEHAYLATNSGRIEALSFVTPVAFALDWLMFYSDANNVLTIGIVSVAGVIVGAAVHALATREFRWEGFGDVGDLGRHLTGALLMGVGGVVAMGCTIGQGLSGLSTLSLASGLALIGIFAGAIAALRYQMWAIERVA